MSGAGRGDTLLPGHERALHPVQPRAEPTGDDIKPLPDLRVNVLADHRAIRPDGQMHEGGAVLAVLITAQHHRALAGHLVLVDVAVPRHLGLLTVGSADTATGRPAPSQDAGNRNRPWSRFRGRRSASRPAGSVASLEDAAF